MSPLSEATVVTERRVGVPAQLSQPRRRRKGRAGQLMVGTVLSVMVFVSLFPFVFMFITSFKTNTQFYTSYWVPTLPPDWGNYATAWRQIQPYFLTTVIVAAISIGGIVLLATTAAFVFARYDFFGRKALFGMIACLLMVPGISSLIPLFILTRDLGILNTRIVLVIPHVAGGTVLAIILIKTFVEGIPQELFDAARVDGAGGPRMFGNVMLPLSLPVIGTVALITVIGVWNDFFWPLLTVTDNNLRSISVGLSFFQGQNATQGGPLFAGYTLASIPLLLLFIFLSKYFLAGIQGGVPGGSK
ncbi:MAG: carbohydrate ABC transporter permease [Mycobacterium sp.]|nr:carbohydrate ABC transporter permease [Mycobacterium sp.]